MRMQNEESRRPLLNSAFAFCILSFRGGLTRLPFHCSLSPAMKRLLLLSLVIAVSAFGQKRPFTLEDVYRIRNVGALSLSPDGRSVLYTVAVADLPHAKRTTHIWMMDA